MNIEYLADEDIRARADQFRDHYAQDLLPPIDVVYIAEIDLKLELIPTPQLFAGRVVTECAQHFFQFNIFDQSHRVGDESGRVSGDGREIPDT